MKITLRDYTRAIERHERTWHYGRWAVNCEPNSQGRTTRYLVLDTSDPASEFLTVRSLTQILTETDIPDVFAVGDM